jgi:NitT/TauT family transport system substrate-binding protein
LNVVLSQAGLSEADIEPLEIPDADGATAFLLQEVDAVSTWGAMLFEAQQAPHGHLLTDSSEQPGTIVDCLITTAARLEARRADFQALGRAWDAAVDYVHAHPDEAIQIMADLMGGAHGDPKVFAEALQTVRLYDGEGNREFFGTPDRPGQIYQTAQIAIDVWSRLGGLKVPLTPADVIRHDLWTE